MNYGKKEGEICNRDGCCGIIEESDPVEELSCTCFQVAPCTKCMTPKLSECLECGWTNEE